MIYYSAFVMDALTRRILLFCRDHHRIWQTAHTNYRRVPRNDNENSQGTSEAFNAVFTVDASEEQPRIVEGQHFCLTITKLKYVHTVFEYGDILPWDIGEALKLNLDDRTRQAIKKNMGLLMFFADVDREIWCNMQEFAHASGS